MISKYFNQWMAWLADYWHAKQRQIDLDVLWPSCKEAAHEQGLPLAHAKMAFAAHCYHDHAWLALGEDEIYKRIDELQ